MNQPAETAHGPLETLLIIDDEPDVCFVLERILHRLGHAAITSNTGDAGIALYRKHVRTIRAVFLDLTMEGMNGFETLQQLRMINPVLRVIVMSGYDDGSFLNKTADQYTTFLHKPFMINDIQNLLAHEPV